MTIADELNDIDESKEYLVLTEDGNTDMISKILEIHSFDLSNVQLESYDGKDNLASATFFAKKLIDKSTNLKKILIHQDRDNNKPQQIKQIISKHLRSYNLEDITTVLVTKHYDIESYFLNKNHINSVFPSITIERADELISLATKETEEVSKGKLRKALAQYGKYEKMNDPQDVVNEINALYDNDPIQHRYGKAVLYKLEELIGTEVGNVERENLSVLSEHIKIKEIEKFKASR